METTSTGPADGGPGGDAGPTRSAAPSARSRAGLGWRLLKGRKPTSWSEIRRAAVNLVLSWIVLSVTIWVTPGVNAAATLDVLLAAVILGVLHGLVQPLVTSVALMVGWLGVLLASVFAEAAFFYAALSLTPGISVDGFWNAFWASWLFSLLVTAATWLVSAGDDTAFLTNLLRQSRKARAQATTTTVPGVVFLQIDGLSAPLLRWAIRSGDLPTLSRWIRSGSHTLTEWEVQLPSTTPASQAGLLHGASSQVPAFRWYEKENDRLLVANRPKDAYVIQQRLSDGRGLLADGGVGISNIFTGDAPTALLTMSAVTAPGSRRGPSRGYATYFINPYGLSRSLVLSVGEMVKERHQGRRQRRRAVEPRIERHGSYVVLRAVTNVLLRDLNAGLIVEQMMSGRPSIFCDFTDYDEIAHHAGPTRPESLASLAGLDHLIGVLHAAAEQAPRPYEFVIVSDHGQSQGATFRQRHGQSLEDLVRELLAGRVDTVTAATNLEETAGPANTLLSQVGEQGGATGKAVRRATRHRSVGDEVHLESGAPKATVAGTPTQASPDGAGAGDVVVIASGNLAMVYFTRFTGRMSREEIDAAYPGLVASLAMHPGIGYVVVRSQEHGTVALGRGGTRYLDEGRVEGRDPLRAFGGRAEHQVGRHAALEHVGDLVLNSPLYPGTDEVAAYEELVGNHGGLGGWQTQAVLVHPTAWPLDQDAPLAGADEVHRQLVRWLRLLGHRSDIPDPTDPPGPAQVEAVASTTD
ncbi:phage holin family protein [Knoellia sp. p5-6-4]|uniref:phage holin family protein n=1 Tax=unclassified Knoellia TaxID=2618719 RepID=UPI0023DA7472|nr:phage holin family protein [Knoellia sp. p5-6-4]MDF2143480.1 phage holin family protein [Knoellia sp. p5-6-4]